MRLSFFLFLTFIFSSVQAQYLDSALLWSASRNNIEKVEKYLLSGAYVNATDKENGKTALVYAVENNNLQMVKLLIEYGADPNIIPSYGKGALEAAAYYGYNDILNYLLENGANPDLANVYGTPVGAAVAGKNYYAIKQLFKYNANPEYQDYAVYLSIKKCDTLALSMILGFGYTPNDKGHILEAARFDCLKAIPILLIYGANINETDQYGNNAFDYYLKFNHNAKDLSYLYSFGLEITEKNYITSLIFYRGKAFKQLQNLSCRKYNKLFLGRLTLSPLMIGTNYYDFQTGIQLGISEIRTNINLRVGVFQRFFTNKVWIQIRPHYFYQLKENKTTPYLLISKDFRITNFYISIGAWTFWELRNYEIYFTQQQKQRLGYSYFFKIFYPYKKMIFKLSYYNWPQTNIPKTPHYLFLGIDFIIPLIK